MSLRILLISTSLTLLQKWQTDANLRLSLEQARAILDLKLHRLTGLERQDLIEDLLKLADLIAQLQTILASPEGVSAVIAAELKDLRKRFATPRRTMIGIQ